MTDDKNISENDQSTEEQKPSNEGKTIYREISKEKLKQILEDHKKWLASDGEERIERSQPSICQHGRFYRPFRK